MTGVRDAVRAGSRGERVLSAAKLMLGWVALLWLLELVDVVSGHALDGFGIVPRTPSELVDVVPAAFVHFGFAHVAANTVPLLVLGFLAALGVLVGVLVAAVWGGSMLAGLAPTQSGVSWQGHLVGLVAGVAAAFVLRRRDTGPRGEMPV
jgi:membrane associated rhomboid family serine protease